MRKTILAAAAVAAVLTANKAAAMPTAAPSQLGLATSDDTSLVEKAAIVCGYYGCRRMWWGGPYWVHPWQRHYWGWHRW